MSNNITVGSLLSDKDKVTLSQNDLFDRVINLKLVTGDFNASATPSGSVALTKDTFVIRSDYELVYPDLGINAVFKEGSIPSRKYNIRKCQYKPSIKVQFKNVSPTTNIEMDIFIGNFYMIDANGNKLMSFNNSTYPLRHIELQMGYFGQFSKNPPKNIEEYFDFKAGYGIDVISLDVQYVTTESLPPDYTLHIHAYVGSNNVSSPVGETGIYKYESLTKSSYVFGSSSASDDRTLIDQIFYENVTRRYMKSTVSEDGIVVTDGQMTTTVADKKGIRVYTSNGVKELSKIRLQRTLVSGDEEQEDTETIVADGKTAEGFFNDVKSWFCCTMKKRTLTNGDWLVYLAEEESNVDELEKRVTESRKEEDKLTAISAYGNILPAVYNINIDAMATITAPFFYFIEPFEYVYFENRYNLSNLVSYWAGITGRMNKFYCIQQSISFATVEEINEMMLVAVSNEDSSLGE